MMSLGGDSLDISHIPFPRLILRNIKRFYSIPTSSLGSRPKGLEQESINNRSKHSRREFLTQNSVKDTELLISPTSFSTSFRNSFAIVKHGGLGSFLPVKS
jgi:hypothetical protein